MRHLIMATHLRFDVEFHKKLEKYQPTYDVKGVVTASGTVYPLGSDTKVLSSIFEYFARPLIYQIAQEHKLTVREARAQNYYPDFTLMKAEHDATKIAVDVKTTYRETDTGWRVRFTLGGYTSFIREATESKNIEFPYSQYAKHWIIGYIYKRVGGDVTPAHLYPLKRLKDIPVPLAAVDVFVQEKWRIAGDTAGSGNTTNIGSITGTLEDFRKGRGVFESEEEFLEYWRNYGRTARDRAGTFNDIHEFRAWKKKNRRRV